MAYENETLGALLSDPRIAPIAAEAIRNRNMKEEFAVRQNACANTV